jgi:DNA-nicking Smr family endonuclease
VHKKSLVKKRNKLGILILDSDHDFLQAFESKVPDSKSFDQNQTSHENMSPAFDKNGMPLLDAQSKKKLLQDENIEDFETLLAQSFIQKTSSLLTTSRPMPVIKRIKRYPPVEIQLDLHGCTSMQAQAKVRSFIQNSKQQGYFTVRIIVGKGRHSLMGPVLPDVVHDLVVTMKKEGSVLWFEWDQKNKARSGALIVYIKQFDRFD